MQAEAGRRWMVIADLRSHPLGPFYAADRRNAGLLKSGGHGEAAPLEEARGRGPDVVPLPAFPRVPKIDAREWSPPPLTGRCTPTPDGVGPDKDCSDCPCRPRGSGRGHTVQAA